MPTRMRSRKKPEPGKKSTPMAMGPMIGLMAVCLVAMAGMYWWTSRHAAKPASLPSAPASVPATPAFAPKHIYLETANPSADIAAALTQAKREHKRVIVDFGGDWCGDCQALDIYLHQAPNDALLADHFVPALAVLDGNGTVVYAQKAGEFEDMRHMEPGSVTEFLEKWKS